MSLWMLTFFSVSRKIALWLTKIRHVVGGYLSDAQQWRFVLGMSCGGSVEFARTVTRRPKNYSRSNICSQVVFTSVILASVLTSYKTTHWQLKQLKSIGLILSAPQLETGIRFLFFLQNDQFPNYSNFLVEANLWVPLQRSSGGHRRFFHRNEWV